MINKLPVTSKMTPIQTPHSQLNAPWGITNMQHAVSKNTNRADRIHINVNMRFPPQDSKLLVMKNPSFSKAIMEISEVCTTCNLGHQWIKDGENIAGLAIFSHVDEQILDRVSFHNAWDNVARVSGHVQKILRSNFSGFSAQNNTTDATIDKSMYG